MGSAIMHEGMLVSAPIYYGNVGSVQLFEICKTKIGLAEKQNRTNTRFGSEGVGDENWPFPI